MDSRFFAKLCNGRDVSCFGYDHRSNHKSTTGRTDTLPYREAGITPKKKTCGIDSHKQKHLGCLRCIRPHRPHPGVVITERGNIITVGPAPPTLTTDLRYAEIAIYGYQGPWLAQS